MSCNDANSDSAAGSPDNEHLCRQPSASDSPHFGASRSASQTDILEFIWATTTVAPLPSAWPFLEPVEKVRCLRQDAPDLIATSGARVHDRRPH